VEQIAGDEVVRIFGQFSLGQRRDKMMDPAGSQQQQQQSADRSAAPFRPLPMMPISKTRSNQFFGLNTSLPIFSAISWLVGRVSGADCRKWRRRVRRI
jgi:hypothetical protein